MTENWEHNLQLSIHSFYVGEMETGFRACERLLNSSASEGVRNNAMQNMAFYIQPLSKRCSVTYTKINCTPAHEKWSLFNPTIINYNSGYLILVRSSNYLIDHNGRYIIPEIDNSTIKTEYIQLITDKNLNIIKEDKVSLPTYQKTNYPVDGMEDIRIFKVKDQYYVSGTMRNMHPYDYICRIGLAAYDPVKNQIGDIRVIYLNNDRHEKNWMPINESCSIEWIYACADGNKTKIVDQGSYIEEIECSFPGAKDFRGGSQLIKIKNKYYCIIHEVSNFEGKRVYYHRMVEWSENFKISKISKLFSLRENNIIEFAAGMSFDENNTIHITFGLKDKEAWVASLSLQDFYILFEN